MRKLPMNYEGIHRFLEAKFRLAIVRLDQNIELQGRLKRMIQTVEAQTIETNDDIDRASLDVCEENEKNIRKRIELISIVSEDLKKLRESDI